MFLPNLDCKIARVTGFTGSGKRNYGAWTKARCAIVRLELMTEKTSVRTDASASRGSALDDNIKSRLLFPHFITLKAGDRVMVTVGAQGFILMVTSVFPRHSVGGRLDHWQLDLEIDQASI